MVPAKTLVMSMLFMPQPFLFTDLDTWTKPDAESVKYRKPVILGRKGSDIDLDFAINL